MKTGQREAQMRIRSKFQGKVHIRFRGLVAARDGAEELQAFDAGGAKLSFVGAKDR